MTFFDHPDGVEPVAADPLDGPEVESAGTVKRPSRWSVRNWPVRWKVLAIALLPMVLAGVFGGLRVSSALGDASRLRLVADRAEMVPAITNYMTALDSALVAVSSDGDAQGAKKNYENRKYELQSRLSHTDAAADVQSGVTTLAERGQALMDMVLSNEIGLRDEVTGYAPILLTAEDAINGSVRVDDAQIRAQTEGLSRAVGARGQMMMHQLLVNRGGELPDPELRASMMTLAGTEPSTLFGMSEVLGVDSPEVKTLQQQMVTRMAVISNPDDVLPNNPVLRDSIRTTDEIAARVISETSGALIKSVEDQAADRRNAAIRDIVLVLTTIGIALVVVWLVARSLVRPLRTLRDGALQIAHTDLEHEIARVRAGDEREPMPLPVYTTEEVGQVAHAVDELHAQALLLAGDEARLRRLVSEMFETMSRRNRSLVDQQLALIDRLERDEDDPDRLESLFRLDHLAARMRRNGANLLVLAGARKSHDRGHAVPLATVISAATSEVEGYHRVQTVLVPTVTVVGTAAADTVHLLAELMDNALRYSPPTEKVRVVAAFEGDGAVVVEVVDAGLGMTDTDLRMANMRLSAGGELTPENARHMGLFVISRLAERHGIEVRLFPPSPGSRGITAEVCLPPYLLTDGFATEEPARPAAPNFEPISEPFVEPISESISELISEPISVAPYAGGAEPQWHEDYRSADPVVSLLPRRTPGSSGITGVPAAPEESAEAAVEASPPRRELPQPWWEGSTEPEAVEPAPPVAPAPPVERASPADTSTFFSARTRVARDEPGAHDEPGLAAQSAHDRVTDTIYQRMLSESLGDSQEMSHDLDWKSVWDHGWSIAAEVENMPVAERTEHGLPVREPGVRLVPGSATPDSPDDGGAVSAHHRATEEPAEEPVASNGIPRRPAHEAPTRDPDAIRASMSSHFGGVRAGRAHAREVGLDTSEGHNHP